MTVKSGQLCEDTFVCLDATGALATPSAGPVGELQVNGVANAAVVTITGSAGKYKWSVTLPTLAAGDLVSMYITATIGTVATAEVVWQETADTKRISDLNDLAAGGAMTLTAGERTTLAASVVAALTASAAYLAAVGARVWANPLRTLTQTAAQIAAVLSGTSLTIQRGDTLSLSLTGLGNLAGRSKLYFAVKENPLGDVDDESLLLIEETAGLTVVNKAPHATTTDGSITVTDEATGAVTITVKPAATGSLPPGLRRYAAIEAVIAGEVSTLTQWDRTVTITADVVRATS